MCTHFLGLCHDFVVCLVTTGGGLVVDTKISYFLKTIFRCHVRNIMKVIHFVHYKDEYVHRKIPCKFFEDRWEILGIVWNYAFQPKSFSIILYVCISAWLSSLLFCKATFLKTLYGNIIKLRIFVMLLLCSIALHNVIVMNY